jgi:dipeptide transport system permease protein
VLRFFLTRVSLILPTFVGMTLLAFFLIRLVPGDPIETMAGERGIDAVRHETLRKEYGFDRPVLVQYGIDLGKSMITQEPVIREFAALFPATIELAVSAILFALILGIPAGMLAAVRRNSVFDHGVMGVSLAGYSMPIFWWGLLLILLFSVQLGWTPVSGRIDVRYFVEPVTGFLTIDSLLSDEQGALASTFSHLLLPMIVLGTNPLAIIARMTRSAMLEVLGEDYIRTARAKGLSNLRVIALHAFRNALIPVVTVIGPSGLSSAGSSRRRSDSLPPPGVVSGTFTANTDPFRPAAVTVYSPDSSVSGNRATPISSPADTATAADSPSGPVTAAVSPTAVTGRNSSTGSPTRTVCRSGLAAANRRSSWTNGR